MICVLYFRAVAAPYGLFLAAALARLKVGLHQKSQAKSL